MENKVLIAIAILAGLEFLGLVVAVISNMMGYRLNKQVFEWNKKLNDRSETRMNREKEFTDMATKVITDINMKWAEQLQRIQNLERYMVIKNSNADFCILDSKKNQMFKITGLENITADKIKAE